MKTKSLKTFQPKLADLKPNWYLLDAQDVPLGRLASQIAQLLIGKHKTYYVPHLNCGDYVVVINAKKVALTGQKEQTKLYYRHSGYPGSLKQKTVQQQRQQDATKIIKKAVKGMLPKNKLLKIRLNQLKVYLDDQHAHEGQKPQLYDLKINLKLKEEVV